MQRITFTTIRGTVTVDDVNISTIAGEKIFRLDDFDGNSGKTRTDSVHCIEMPGQKTVSVTSDVKTVTAKISFAPVYMNNNIQRCAGAAGMFALRREVLKRFPLGESGTLEYTNDTGTYTIKARIDESPVIAMHDGYFCSCTIMFTCDYPYWCSSVKSSHYTVVSGTPAIITPAAYGDISSPVAGVITCISSLSGLQEGYLEHFRLIDSSLTGYRVSFCKAMTAGDMLSFCFGYNNEWQVRKSTNGGTSWANASDYVYFTDWTAPPTSDPVRQNSLKFELLESGSLDVQLEFLNLYTAV